MGLKYSLPKANKLKSRKDINALFENGQSVFQYPFRLNYCYTPKNEGDEHSLQVAVSVSKRKFGKAVYRNRLKRQMRELIRLHKYNLPKKEGYILKFMLIYVANDFIKYTTLNNKYLKLLDKWKVKA